MYLPPCIACSDFNAFLDKLQSTLDDIMLAMPLYHLIVAGDFNQHNMSPLSLQFSLVNIVNGPTREDACLDQILVDTRLLCEYRKERTEIGPPVGKSDHRCVYARPNDDVSKRSIKKHILYDLRMSHVLAFEQRFLDGNWSNFYSRVSLDEKCEIFYRNLLNALEEIPRKEVYLTNRDAPWMTLLIKYLIDRRWEAYRSRDWSLFNVLKLKVKNAITRAKLAFVNKKKDTVKGLWSVVNMERGSLKRDLTLLFEDAPPGELLNEINEHFCKFMNPEGSQMPIFEDKHDDDWMPIVSVHDVSTMLSKLSSKAAGSDDVPTLLYKKSALIFAEPLHHLMTECLFQRKFPSKWKIADVVPIPKPGEVIVTNTRPISLLPVPAKLLEKVILVNMRDRLTALLGESQYAIRRRSSTTHAIITVHDALTRLADDSRIGAAAFVSFDFSKAFDTVDHCLLLGKLCGTNLPIGFIILMKDYLHNRVQRVRLSGFKSEARRVTSGVPQGSLLGPYLFGLYVSSLRPVNDSTCMVKYMDDICIVTGVRKSYPLQDVDRINFEVDNLLEWSKANHLKLNVSKTNGLVRYRGRFMETCDIESKVSSVHFLPSLRFLGVFLDDNLYWTSHISHVVRKCAQRLYILRRMKAVVPMDECQLIYKGLIRSLMEYACPAFIGLSVRDSKRLTKIQRRCMKIIGLDNMENLDSRRQDLALRLFQGLSMQGTSIKELIPPCLPSGRPSVIFCNSSLRQSSFLPIMSTIVASTCTLHRV